MQNIVSIPASNFKFALQDPAALQIMGMAPHQIFLRCLDAVSAAAVDIDAVNNDPNLSQLGRTTKTQVLAERAWAVLVSGYVGLANFSASTDAREQSLIAVPKLDPSASAVATEDVEARTYFRNLPDKQRMAIMAGMENDAATGAKYSRLQIALLRSPVPLPDADTDLMAKIWKTTCRTRNVGESLAIDTERNAMEWCQAALAHLYAALKTLTLWMAPQIALFIAADKTRASAAPLMGFSDMQMADAARQLDPTHYTRRIG